MYEAEFQRQHAMPNPDALNRFVNSDLFTTEYRVKAGRSAVASSVRAARHGCVDVLFCEGGGPRFVKRAYQHIRRDTADDILITAPVNARVDVAQRGMIEHINPEGFACLSTTLPMYSRTAAHTRSDDRFSLYLVRIPAPVLRKVVPQIDDFCNRFVSARAGAGRIMISLFEQAIAQGEGLNPAQSQRFGAMLIDAVINATVEAPEFAAARTPLIESASTRVRHKALAYIAAHLSNADLAVADIAAHCQVSRRYIDAVFAAQGQTPGGIVREHRLLACREDLRNPALRHRSVAQISLRWGFTDPAYFSRAYKVRFGHPPKQERPTSGV